MPTFSDAVNALRFLSVDMIEYAQSGHPGLPLGMADIVSILFQEFLVFDPEDPSWANRDRFVLSAGHGSALLYALLHLCGYSGIGIDDLGLQPLRNGMINISINKANNAIAKNI